MEKEIYVLNDDISFRKCDLFSDEERLAMLKQLVAPYVNVTVNPCDCLIVDYAREHGANVLLRGIRNTNDFSYEFDLAMMNRSLSHQIETLFIPTEQRFVVLKSSAIKELAMFGGDISGMVPPIVAQALYSKFPNARKK